MSITVAKLLEMSHLRCRLIAGRAVTTRRVSWAHTCELKAPWEWLGRGDLVMTTGLGIPLAPEAQVDYVERSAAAGIVGTAIGEEMSAPPISPEMLKAADEVGFCLIMTAYEVPFVALARSIASASQLAEQERLVRTVRVYEVVRQSSAQQRTGAALLTDLESAMDCRLALVDIDDGHALLDGGAALSPNEADCLSRALGTRGGPPPAVLPLDFDPDKCEASTLALAVPGFRQASLIVTLTPGQAWRDPAVLRHVATVAALELVRRDADRERDRRLGSTLLAHLVDERIDRATAMERLAERGLTGTPLVMTAFDYDESGPEIHHVLGDRGVAHAVLVRSDVTFVLLANRSDSLSLLQAVASPIGVSDPISDPLRIEPAATEARLALAIARDQNRPLLRYGSRGESTLLPRSTHEAHALVRGVLGPLLEYDADRGRELTRSLQVFI
jgi:purine catabolism regulator